jgi:NAD+ synthase
LIRPAGGLFQAAASGKQANLTATWAVQPLGVIVSDRLTIALAQLNPLVGDMAGNCKLALDAQVKAAEAQADLVVFPELFLAGYPPEDLVLKPAFLKAVSGELEVLAKATASGPAMLMGLPWRDGDKLYNAQALLEAGKVRTMRYKADLPNYGVFDEKRVFEEGPPPGPLSFNGVRLGVPICEDIWAPDICETLEESGAEILVVPNGSPYWREKHDLRMNVAAARVTETGLPMAYLNMTGGQDELVFDGASFVLNADCSLAVQAPAWEDAVVVTRWRRDGDTWQCEPGDKAVIEEGHEAVYLACVAGLRDYVDKNRFPGVVLGMSGGIDSALCAALAVDALGADKVHCVMLPYKYTSSASLRDAEQCASLLGVRYDIASIEAPVEGFNAALADLFKGQNRDVTEENIQSRARGTLLMALSNKFGTMLVTTGNKSEVSVGYATLYGDMNGGFNPIKDVYKSDVFALARLRNDHKPKGCLGPKARVIPENIITKPPTAELAEGQKDEDSLPPYDELDQILQHLVEHDDTVDDIVAKGFERETVARIEHLLYIAEYKRRQAAPGVKISRKNFGRDRRYPITSAFRDRR